MTTPYAVLEALAVALPKLRAEETITAAQAHALGAGTMRKADARALEAELMRRARRGERSDPLTPERLAALGFTVEKG